MKNLFKSLAVLALIFSLTSFDDEDKTAAALTKLIVTIAAENSNLSILVQALYRAALVATFDAASDYTVIAPTNSAFQ